MIKKKIFILLPDGIGLRNFAYTDFCKEGNTKNFDVHFWNATIFDLKALHFNEIKLGKIKIHPLTDILKNAKIQVGLNQFIKKENDIIYDTYRFPFASKSLKAKLKANLTKIVISYFNSGSQGIRKLDKWIQKLERRTKYYQNCLQTLKKEQPAFVFCTNQRIVGAIAPLLAAQDLGIPTGTFIFSWDNLPKSTLIVETDFYFVWSNYMKEEILHYYPNINPNQVIISGTPQFEPYFEKNNLIPKELFFKQYGLKTDRKYICYSGDDITTCPDDPQYLEDIAMAVEVLNEKGYDLGIVFRRSPVDFSDRYDKILQKHQNTIVPLNPKWERIGEHWNTVCPLQEDSVLLTNTVANTEMVINLGSSMVFDYVTHQKPCCYINYDVRNKRDENWSVEKIYKFVHFRSMPDKNSVIWLNSKDEIASKIEVALSDSKMIVANAQKWFEIINQNPPEKASERLWDAIAKITA